MCPDSPTVGGMLSRCACRVLLPSSMLSVMLASRKETPNSLSLTIPIRLPRVLRGTSPVTSSTEQKYQSKMSTMPLFSWVDGNWSEWKSQWVLPGHRPVWHFLESTLGPLQERPPFAGCGLLQDLSRSWTPCPHVLLQGPHSSQLE